jgi:DNA polymerase-3 subunit epsilon
MVTQRSFEDLGTPLSEVTFCVVDLETTGGSPANCAITEVGACKVRRGEVVGTFQSLVNPNCHIPAYISTLTGIDQVLVSEAPAIEGVLPNLLEFVKGSVLVAHNARFDVSFLNAALERSGYPRLANDVVDTAKLARKILAGEVPNNRLETLARHLRCAHKPNHRAYPDVLATIDVLHHLIERVAGFGVTTLEDLMRISATRLDGTFKKISLADDVPKGIGVYRFIGTEGRILYVGKATDLRSRVRSYFYGDPRRKIRNLLRETQRLEHDRYDTLLEAEIAEAREIARDRPSYNRAGKSSGKWFVKISGGRSPKVSMARVEKPDDATYLGPYTSMRTARMLMDALRDAAPIHRCTEPKKCEGCAFADIGTCAGREQVPDQVLQLARAIEASPGAVLDPLVARMNKLARQERYEEAAEIRDRGALLERTLARGLESRAWSRCSGLVLEIDGKRLSFEDGRLCAGTGPPAPEEWKVLSSWLRRHGGDARIISVGGELAFPVGLGAPSRFKTRDPDQAPD